MQWHWAHPRKLLRPASMLLLWLLNWLTDLQGADHSCLVATRWTGMHNMHSAACKWFSLLSPFWPTSLQAAHVSQIVFLAAGLMSTQAATPICYRYRLTHAAIRILLSGAV